MSGFNSPADNKIDITYDDTKTDEQRITQALVKGGLPVKTKPAPAW